MVSQKKKIEVLDLNDKSQVINNTMGFFILFNELTNRKKVFKKYGEFARFTNSELMDMNMSMGETFSDAFVLIKNPLLVEEMGYTEIYQYVLFSEKEIDALLIKSDEEIKEFYENCPKGMKEILVKFVKIKIERGESVTDSRSKVEFFENLFSLKFADYWKENLEILKRK